MSTLSYEEEYSFLNYCTLFLAIHPQICSHYKVGGIFLFQNVDGLPLTFIYRDVLKSGLRHYILLISINYRSGHINHRILEGEQNNRLSIALICLKVQALEHNKIMSL